MKKMKVWSTVLATGVALTTLAACSGGSNSTTASSSEEKADKSQELVIYSNSVSNGRGDWLTAKAKEAGFNIKMVDIAGAQLADRVIAEKNNAVADMVFGIGAVDSNKIRDQKLLVQYKPKWLDKIDQSLSDKDNYYNPVIVQPLVLIGAPDVKEMPKDWTELGSKYKGKYSIYGLQGGTGRAILASILVRYLDEKGDLGVSEKGWEVAKEYFANAYTLQKGESSVVKALDKEFIDWFGQSEIQVEYSKKFGSIPANKDALKELPEDTKKFVDQVKPQNIDWEAVGKHLDEWVEKAELEYVK
ncbi:type 2 periplasmic-binding domain-containing protein [Streptococcus pneumoniae]|uniref:ABC transporter substrate-binding protein n=1 Tax=Streptococcus pneumoniae TaxID=1313 RepID=UPI0005E7B6A8|nr:ABC transporter substrate-binding protein [Streptococcus pneumoniae]CKJ39555.1 ABC transporter substrate-binding protein [Streptococcus pneumoniae]